MRGRELPGGCASNRELAAGVTVSDCAQWLGQFDRDIIKDLKLVEHGLALGEVKRTVALQTDGKHLVFDGNSVSGAELSGEDRDAYRRFTRQMNAFAGLVQKLYRQRPPKLVDSNWRDRWTLIRLGLGLKLLGRENMRDLMRVALINIYDVLNEHFNHAGLKAAVALDAVTGSTMGASLPQYSIPLSASQGRRPAGARGSAASPWRPGRAGRESREGGAKSGGDHASGQSGGRHCERP